MINRLILFKVMTYFNIKNGSQNLSDIIKVIKLDIFNLTQYSSCDFYLLSNLNALSLINKNHLTF